MVSPLAGPDAQISAQFLNNVLSQRGPSALPYKEDVKWLIRQHLLSLIQDFPSLQAKTAIFTHNDGTPVNLLQAEGTIPMYYHHVLYNIPSTIWLMETYPRQSPLVYVTPTRDMIIKQGHPHVNPSGMVSIPYLREWVFPSSNLVDLVKNLSHLFGCDPPLYTKQSVSSTATTNARPPLAHMDDHAEVFKRNAINKLVEMLHTDATALRKSTELEMDGIFNTQSVLRQREEQLAKGLREMRDEKEGLEQQLQMILTNAGVLESWSREENEGKMMNKATTDVVDDDVVFFEPCDGLSRQMLECTATDLAIDDVIYSLDKAVQGGAIPFDAYVKNIRSLSREQFFHRATSAKVRAAQMQAQIAGMARQSRPSHYVT